MSYYQLMEVQDEKNILFEMFFQYLRLTSMDNESVKQAIYNQLKAFLAIDLSKSEFYPSLLYFMEELISDNRELLTNEKIVRDFANEILSFILHEDDKFKPICIFALSILKKLIMCDGEVIKESQNIILSLIFSSKYECLFSEFFGSRLGSFILEFEEGAEKYTSLHSTEAHKICIVNPKLRFLNNFFLIVNASIADKNSFTENFCQNLYDLKLLHRILLLS